MMTFDQYGYLTPYTVIETDLQTFEKMFVSDFEASETRRPIFEAYLGYLDQLMQMVGTGFYQWIDGSFVTQKQNPADIDFLTWIDSKIFNRSETELSAFRRLHLKKGSLTDAYLLPYYTTDQRKVYLNDINEKQWLFDWANDNDKNPKGIIKLQF
jgi:hypothetical protein